MPCTRAWHRWPGCLESRPAQSRRRKGTPGAERSVLANPGDCVVSEIGYQAMLSSGIAGLVDGWCRCAAPDTTGWPRPQEAIEVMKAVASVRAIGRTSQGDRISSRTGE